MPRLASSLGVALVLSFFAGCSDESSSPRQVDQTDDANSNETMGRITGRVVDDEKLPMATVQVLLVGLERVAVTDLQGVFGFEDVPIGKHVLEARYGNFTPVRKEVEVQVGKTTIVTIEAGFSAQTTRPHHVLLIDRGYMGCNVNHLACPNYPSPNEKTSILVPFEANLWHVLAEVVINRSSLVPEILQRYTFQVYLKDQRAPLQTINGFPPYFNLSEPAGNIDPAKYSPFRFVVMSKEQNSQVPPGNLPGLAFEQTYTQYTTLFYLERPSPGYTALPP